MHDTRKIFVTEIVHICVKVIRRKTATFPKVFVMVRYLVSVWWCANHFMALRMSFVPSTQSKYRYWVACGVCHRSNERKERGDGKGSSKFFGKCWAKFFFPKKLDRNTFKTNGISMDVESIWLRNEISRLYLMELLMEYRYCSSAEGRWMVKSWG